MWEDRKMKAKYIYNICLEDSNLMHEYEIRANSYKEAVEKAKIKFVKQNYNPKKIKASMIGREVNY